MVAVVAASSATTTTRDDKRAVFTSSGLRYRCEGYSCRNMLVRPRLCDMTRYVFLFKTTVAAALTFSTSAASQSGFARNPSPSVAFLGLAASLRSPDPLVSPLTRMFSATENGAHTALVLPYENGSHNSARVTIPSDDDDSTFCKVAFRTRLEATVASCRALKKSSLWVEVPMSRASFIEDCEEFGLSFHHAVGKVASLSLWLNDSPCKIPEYATHHVGVGAVVVNSRDEILCVRELRNNLRPWKIPGGLSDLGEQIDEAAVREVMEETGVPCQFLTVLSFRHTHGLNLGRSDLYFVCRLAPIEGSDENGNAIIPDPVPEEGEIESAAWVPLNEYRSMIEGEDGHPMMQHIMQLYEQPWKDHDIQKTVVPSIVPGRKPSPIYHPPIRTKNSGHNEY